MVGLKNVFVIQDEIYHQADLFEIQDQFTGKPLFEVRKTSTAIDFTKQFATITSGI